MGESGWSFTEIDSISEEIRRQKLVAIFENEERSDHKGKSVGNTIVRGVITNVTNIFVINESYKCFCDLLLCKWLFCYICSVN